MIALHLPPKSPPKMSKMAPEKSTSKNPATTLGNDPDSLLQENEELHVGMDRQRDALIKMRQQSKEASKKYRLEVQELQSQMKTQVGRLRQLQAELDVLQEEKKKVQREHSEEKRDLIIFLKELGDRFREQDKKHQAELVRVRQTHDEERRKLEEQLEQHARNTNKMRRQHIEELEYERKKTRTCI